METEPTPPPPPPGSRITVRFSDGQDYGGTITVLLDEHRAMVLYDDGQSEAVRFPDSDVKITGVGRSAPSLEGDPRDARLRRPLRPPPRRRRTRRSRSRTATASRRASASASSGTAGASRAGRR